jgi:hypothetical protein
VWFTTSELLWGLALFAVTFVVSLALAVGLLVVLPQRFFVAEKDGVFLLGHARVVRWTVLILKNLAGLALIVVGIALSLPGIPGQGLLTILAGLVLLDFPGKRRLQRRLVAYPPVLRSANRLRAMFGRPPLVV